MSDNNTNLLEFTTGEILVDKTSTGKERPWEYKKIRTELTADHFEEARLFSKAKRMDQCADTLVFRHDGEALRLHQTWFCKVRLCPMCNWRRSIKIATQNKKIVETVNEREKVSWLFLTLTVKNTDAENLTETVSAMFKAWNRLVGYKAFKGPVRGFFRALEVTRDRDSQITEKRFKTNPGYYQSRGLEIGSKNPNYGTYHPHFHVLLCVKPSYFTRDYIKQSDWTDMWQRAMKLDYKPVIHIQKVKPKKEIDSSELENYKQDFKNAIKEQNAILEVSKYPVKDTDVIKGNKVMSENVETVLALDNALAFKRLIGYGGLLKKVHHELNLDDGEDGDLIRVSDEDESTDETANGIFEVTARWHIGIKKYVID
jgi:plasmid rolling circle replication initiator protein Rep